MKIKVPHSIAIQIIPKMRVQTGESFIIKYQQVSCGTIGGSHIMKGRLESNIDSNPEAEFPSPALFLLYSFTHHHEFHQQNRNGEVCHNPKRFKNQKLCATLGYQTKNFSR